MHKDDQRGGRFNRKRPDGQVVEVQTPEQFVFRVASTYDEVWFQCGRSALLLVHRATRNAIVLSVPPVDGVYSVITAFQLRPDHSPRRRNEVCVWTRSSPAPASEAMGGSQ